MTMEMRWSSTSGEEASSERKGVRRRVGDDEVVMSKGQKANDGGQTGGQASSGLGGETPRRLSQTRGHRRYGGRDSSNVTSIGALAKLHQNDRQTRLHKQRRIRQRHQRQARRLQNVVMVPRLRNERPDVEGQRAR